MRLDATDIESLRPLLVEIVREAITDLAPKSAVAESGRLVYSESESAERQGIAIHVLREQRKLGRIAFVRGAGRRIWYRPEDLTEYLNRNRVEAKNEHTTHSR